MKTIFFLLAIVFSLHAISAQPQQPHQDPPPKPSKFIQITQCVDVLCQKNCYPVKRIPENFCHIEHQGSQAQTAECAPAPPKKCIQESVYQHAWGGGGFGSGSSDSGFSGNGPDGNICDDQHAFSTQPRECGVCLMNRVHSHQGPQIEYVKFVNCDRPVNGAITVLTGCDSACFKCKSNETIPLKSCIPQNEFSVSLEYSYPENCPTQLLVSSYNWTELNCTGRPYSVSHTFTGLCYANPHQRNGIKYDCVGGN